MEKDLPYCELKVSFRSKCKLNTLLHFKDSLEKKIHNVIVVCSIQDMIRISVNFSIQEVIFLWYHQNVTTLTSL